ncbi:hypothetical protein L596_024499 [Steinernema carpocapsae]|uniref:Uncharacterized protein n=1 Tax=Steinernema carpocapsae TaxID=34508 RepID=A0A4U5MGX5_STECR|nr:hypothetical protein L596_024499 [Steinernema carpocapsae]
MPRPVLVNLALFIAFCSTCHSQNMRSEQELQRSAFDLLKVDQQGRNPLLDALKVVQDVSVVSQTVARFIASQGLSPVEKLDRIRISIGDSLPLSTKLGSWGTYFDLVRLTLAQKASKFRQLITECGGSRKHHCRLLAFLRHIARSSPAYPFREFAFSVEKTFECIREDPLLLCLRRLECPRGDSTSERRLDDAFSVVDLKNLAAFEHVCEAHLALSCVSQKRNGAFPLLRDLDNTLRCPIVKRSARSVFPDLRNEVARTLMQMNNCTPAEKTQKVSSLLSDFVARRHPDAGEMYRIFDIFQDVLIETKWNSEPICTFPETFFDEKGTFRVADSQQGPLVRYLEETWRTTKDIQRVTAILRRTRFEDAPIGLWGTLGTMIKIC